MGWSAEERLVLMGRSFMERRFETLADCYATPVPIYAGDGIATHLTRAQLVEGLRDLRARFDAAGVLGITPRLIARSLPRARQHRFLVDWVYDFGPDQGSQVASVTYYCRETGLSAARGCPLLIEMVEHRRGVNPRQGGSPLPGGVP